MKTIEQVIKDIEACQHRNKLINEDIAYLQTKGELRRLLGLPDVFLAIKVNQMKINRATKALKALEASLNRG